MKPSKKTENSRLPSVGGTIIIEDRTWDLSMTLIVGIKTDTGLIVGSDGLAKITLGPMQIPAPTEIDQPKVYQISPTLVMGLTGGMLNKVEQFVSDVGRSIRQSPPTSLSSLAKGINSYIPQLYADRLNHPNFALSVFLAGYINDETGVDLGKRMAFLHEGSLYHYDDKEPWMCIGNNRRAYEYVEANGKPVMSNEEAIKLIKGAIAVTAESEDDVGGSRLYL